MGTSSSLLLGGLLLGLGILAIVVVRASHREPGSREQARDRARRAGGSAMLVLQEFVEPRVEQVIEARREVRREESSGDDEDDPESALRAGLSESLARRPIDLGEVRGHLDDARRAGLDWRAIYREAVAEVLAGRPYLAPSMPPVERVAPREGFGPAPQ